MFYKEGERSIFGVLARGVADSVARFMGVRKPAWASPSQQAAVPLASAWRWADRGGTGLEGLNAHVSQEGGSACGESLGFPFKISFERKADNKCIGYFVSFIPPPPFLTLYLLKKSLFLIVEGGLVFEQAHILDSVCEHF